MSATDQSRMSIVLGAVLAALSFSALALFLVLGRSDARGEGDPPLPADGDSAFDAAPPTVLETADRAPAEAGRVVEVAEPRDDSGVVRAVRRADRAPIEGVSIYVDGAAVAGPSGIDGRIEFRRAPAQAFVVWGKGWRPAFVHAADETPAEVALGVGDATLEVHVDGLRPGQVVARTLVKPRAFPAAEDAPWAPRLVPQRFGGYRADDLPPGAYDVYVWLGDADAVGPVLSEPMVLLRSGQTTTLRLDEAAVDVEPDG